MRDHTEPTVVHNLDASSEYERQVALQAIIAAILYAGDTIATELHQSPGAPSLEQCVVRAQKLVTMAENNVGAVD